MSEPPRNRSVAKDAAYHRAKAASEKLEAAQELRAEIKALVAAAERAGDSEECSRLALHLNAASDALEADSRLFIAATKEFMDLVAQERKG